MAGQAMRDADASRTMPTTIEPIRVSTDAEDRGKKREAFRQATLAAWEEYRETGLHFTLEEVESWFAKLDEGQDVEPPPCHM